jgi:hypothetical protein
MKLSKIKRLHSQDLKQKEEKGWNKLATMGA